MPRELEVTRKAKRAIRRWAGLPPSMGVILDDLLADLRPGHLNELRSQVNREFSGEPGMPIEPGAEGWTTEKLAKVRSVRDFVRRRIEG